MKLDDLVLELNTIMAKVANSEITTHNNIPCSVKVYDKQSFLNNLYFELGKLCGLESNRDNSSKYYIMGKLVSDLTCWLDNNRKVYHIGFSDDYKLIIRIRDNIKHTEYNISLKVDDFIWLRDGNRELDEISRRMFYLDTIEQEQLFNYQYSLH